MFVKLKKDIFDVYKSKRLFKNLPNNLLAYIIAFVSLSFLLFLVFSSFHVFKIVHYFFKNESRKSSKIAKKENVKFFKQPLNIYIMRKLMIAFFVFAALNAGAQDIEMLCCKNAAPLDRIMELDDYALKNVGTITILELSMQSPKITTIPADISKFSQLKCLDLGFNRISVIPESFKKLENLTCLILSGNHYLQNLPTFLNELPNLKVIVLEDLKWSETKQKETQERFPNILIKF